MVEEFAFQVQVRVTDPPPGYGLHLLTNIRRELNLRLGPATYVGPLEDSPTQSLIEDECLQLARRELEERGKEYDDEVLADKGLEVMRRYGV